MRHRCGFRTGFRTHVGHRATSEKSHKRTHALQQKASRFNNLEIQWRCGASSCGSDLRVNPPSSIHFLVDCAAHSISALDKEKSNGDTASGAKCWHKMHLNVVGNPLQFIHELPSDHQCDRMFNAQCVFMIDCPAQAHLRVYMPWLHAHAQSKMMRSVRRAALHERIG